MERKIDYEMAKTKNEGLAKILKMEAQSVLGDDADRLCIYSAHYLNLEEVLKDYIIMKKYKSFQILCKSAWKKKDYSYHIGKIIYN